MKVQSFTVNPFAENTYICHDGTDAAIIDPGYHGATERRQAVAYLAENKLAIQHLLLTHAHIDHIIDCGYWSDTTGQSFQMHRDDLPIMTSAKEMGLAFGIEIQQPPIPSRFLREGETVEIGSASWLVLHAPGHSPGSICFYDESNGFLIGGDVIFAGSVGRTDLWQGSMDILIASIRNKILPLPDDTVIYPGHGPATTVGHERRTNPFLVG